MNRWHVIDGLIKSKGYKIGAEVGVKEGRFISHLLANNEQLNMFAIDPWEQQPEGNENYLEWDFDKIFNEYRTKVRPFGSRVIELRDYSYDAAKLIPDNTLDFVFIDAQHDYESCKRDIELFLPKVKSGGLMSGHDYEPNFPGVIKAVQESFNTFDTSDNAVWYKWI